jgi:adenosine kinase
MSAAGKALICGSIAYDSIMVFNGRFKDHILPDKIHMLNVSFLVPQLRREFGGCAGNIAYNLKLLGDVGYPMATVGHDFAPYQQWMSETHVPQDYVRVIATEHTAQAFITTDEDDNQITAFHPGAMQHSQLNTIPTDAGITLGIVAPDGRDGMVQHCAAFAAAGIPFIFDPGQGLPMFSGDDLRALAGQATWLTVNEYEWQAFQQRTGWAAADVVRHVKALIVTRGAEGSTIYTPQGEVVIPAARAQAVVDPTGCGDAYRAGLIHGLLRGLDWPVTGRIASLLGALKVASRGPQNHRFSHADFTSAYRAAFGTDLPR